MTNREDQVLPILVGRHIATIPFPMPEEDFDLLIDTLLLWKRKIVKRELGLSFEASYILNEIFELQRHWRDHEYGWFCYYSGFPYLS